MSATSANPVPEPTLGGIRVDRDGAACPVEAHHRPHTCIVGRPSGRSTGGERDPGAVHHVRESLRWLIAGQAHRAFAAEIVEDESDLERVDRSEATVEER